jgi:ADP-ribose pyrophosphatase YjhB (NUDIX family)
MMRTFFRLWSTLPLWVHILTARLVRPKFGAAVAAIIFNEQNQILLFKHTYRKFEWGLPAGGLEYREQPIDAVQREFLEETGMEIKVERLLTAVSARESPHVSMIYLCSIVRGDFKESHEISEMKYFDIHDLPARMLTAEKELIQWAVEEIK